MRALTISLLMAWPLLAGPSVLDKLQAVYDKTSSFEADFKQTYWNKLFDRTDKSEGTLAYQKPGKMRWDYLKPNKKSFILNGKNLWLVEPAEKIAYINKCFESDGLTASLVFLGGKGKLKQQFIARPGTKANELVLTPKKPNGIFNELVLVYEPTTFRVVQTTLIDPDGNKNQFLFEKKRFNQKSDMKRFEFKAAGGIQLLDMPGSCGVI
ncbi:MAG: outer membrane lipoprotein carrier protein LolA [Myxococcota bacterium]